MTARVADRPRGKPDGPPDPTTREWVACLLVVAVAAVIVVAFGIWFVFFFFRLACGSKPACG